MKYQTISLSLGKVRVKISCCSWEFSSGSSSIIYIVVIRIIFLFNL